MCRGPRAAAGARGLARRRLLFQPASARFPPCARPGPGDSIYGEAAGLAPLNFSHYILLTPTRYTHQIFYLKHPDLVNSSTGSNCPLPVGASPLQTTQFLLCSTTFEQQTFGALSVLFGGPTPPARCPYPPPHTRRACPAPPAAAPHTRGRARASSPARNPPPRRTRRPAPFNRRRPAQGPFPHLAN